MKRRTLVNSLLLVALIAFLVLPFLKIYHEVGVLPSYDVDGNFSTVRVDYYYSALRNVSDLIFEPFLTGILYFGYWGLLASSMALVAVDFFRPLPRAKMITFSISALLFVTLMIAACMVARGY
ncbi:MAG: hypothetical protein SPG64_05825 [Candidatus Enteromonas sp.]|nr:hypothetical protein [Candidatus Enteromonas sp.]